MLLGFRIGAARQPHVIGVLDQAGPHLLPVDDVIVTVTDRRRAQRGQVGAGLGLGVADREVELTARDLGQEEGLLLVRTEMHDCRRYRIDRQERHRCTGDGGFVGEDQLVHRGAFLSAVLFRPTQGEPAVLAHLRDDFAVHIAFAVLTRRGG